MTRAHLRSLLRIPVVKLVDLIGQRTLAALAYVWALIAFTLSSLLTAWRGSDSQRIRLQSVVSQIIFSGVGALPVITILSLAVALSVTAQLILLLQALTTEKEVIRVISRIVAQEFTPLLTAIILIGRSGSAIAVDLGNMKLHDEIRGLQLLGIDIHSFFVLPRILGMAFSQFALTVYFAVFVMVGGVIFAALLDSPSNYKFLFLLVQTLTPYELIVFILKNLLFGIIIGATACFHGLRVERSVTEVPQQTQQAIVNSLVIVFVFDGLVALLS